MFAEILKTLPSITHVRHISLENEAGECIAAIENKPGQAGSLAVYHYLGQEFGAITPLAAKKGLDLYAEHTEDARQYPGKHPNIDRLLNVLDSKQTFYIRQYHYDDAV